MNYILFGDQNRAHFMPFTFLRPLADIRLGILTLREKWEKLLHAKPSSLTEAYLSEKYPLLKKEDNVLINSRVLPDQDLVEEMGKLKPNQTLISGQTLIAHRLREEDIDNMKAELLEEVEPMETRSNVRLLKALIDLVAMNGQAIRDDFDLLTRGRKSQPLPAWVQAVMPEAVFVEEGTRLGLCIINASAGPVYIGKGATVMDGAIIQGPAAVGDHSIVRMGARIYNNTSIGPYSKIGGEVTDSIVFGYSNKAHDGFLGHSVIGEWCNLGAATNTSNLKNNYMEPRLWDYAESCFVETGSLFCGTFMGDHTRCGINTMFNTGTVVGVNAQVYGTGFMRNFIPSFSIRSVSGTTSISIETAVETARRAYARKNLSFDAVDEGILRHVYEMTLDYRHL